MSSGLGLGDNPFADDDGGSVESDGGAAAAVTGAGGGAGASNSRGGGGRGGGGARSGGGGGGGGGGRFARDGAGGSAPADDDRYAGRFDFGRGDRRGGFDNGADDDGSGIPDAVKDFIRSFYDAICGGNQYEITRYYESEWKTFTDRYFASSRWPQHTDVEDLFDEDPVFSVLYRLLYYKHVLAYLPTKKIPAKLEDHVEAWDAYRDFFGLVLDESYAKVELPAQWLYEILSEFIYQFQNFLQLRSKPEELDEDEREQLRDEFSDVWGIVDVLRYQHMLVDSSHIKASLAAGEIKALPKGLLPLLGYFSLICLCRMHCQLGDYSLALAQVRCMDLTNEALFSLVPACHVTLYYYMGFSLMMSRRYVEALKVFSRILLYFNRTKNMHRGSSQGGIMKKRADQMLALLAVCHVLCPGQRMDDQVKAWVNKLHSETISNMRGANPLPAFEDVFTKGAPSFISPHTDLTADIEQSTAEMTSNQVKLFMEEVRARVLVLPTTRSYLGLYTTIDVPKLSAFCKVTESETHANLVRLKLNMYQNQGGVGRGASEVWATVDPMHFYVNNDMVHVDEVEVKSDTNRYFADHIAKFDKMIRDVSVAGTRTTKGRGNNNRGTGAGAGAGAGAGSGSGSGSGSGGRSGRGDRGSNSGGGSRGGSGSRGGDRGGDRSGSRSGGGGGGSGGGGGGSSRGGNNSSRGGGGGDRGDQRSRPAGRSNGSWGR